MPIQTDSAPHSMPSFVTIGWGTPIACIAHGIVAPSIRRVGYSGHMHMPTKQEIRYQWEHGGPVMTWALIAACTAVWLVEVLLGFLSPTLQSWLIGHWRFLGLYMISGLGGALGMMVWAVVAPGGQGWQTAAYGASGALFGLFAALLVVYRRIGADIRSMLIWMAVNFALPVVVGGVAWQAHVGGFVVGGLLTWLLIGGIRPWRGKSLAWRMQVYGWSVTVLVIALIVACNFANPYGWMWH